MAVSSSSISSVAAFTAAAALWTRLPLPVEAVDVDADATDNAKAPKTTTTHPTIPSWTLGGGVRMPVMALNTAGLSVDGTERALALACQCGIVHVDFHPGRERDGVANYLSDNPETRSELFLTTKIGIAPKGTSPKDASERVRLQIADDLAILDVTQVDMLMLRDSPDAKVMQSQWAALEDALAKGQTRAIGVINFCEFALDSVLRTAKTTPAVNYCLHHVGMGTDPRGLRSFGESRGIRTFAYGALGEPGPNRELRDSPVLHAVARAHRVSPDAVALRWILQTGAAVSVRPTSEFGLGTASCPAISSNDRCERGLRERASSFGWELTTEEMDALSALTSPYDNPTLFSSAGCPDAFGMKEMMAYFKSI